MLSEEEGAQSVQGVVGMHLGHKAQGRVAPSDGGGGGVLWAS